MIQCPFCRAQIPSWKELEHFNANHMSDEESSEAENKKENTRRQKKKKAKN